MVLTPSTETPVGSSAPAFDLPDTNGTGNVSLASFMGKPVMIIFMCNHCPYVVHILDSLVSAAKQLAAQGIATIAISANDASSYPADSPDNMRKLAQAKQFSFPYLHDESQDIARAYNAVCTPDLYLYDSEHKLYYRGQFDSSRPGSGSATGKDLIEAATGLANGDPAPANPPPSVGCSIKWS